MKLCRFDDDRLGLVQGDELVDVTAALEALINHGDEIRAGIEGIGELAVRVAPDYAG